MELTCEGLLKVYFGHHVHPAAYRISGKMLSFKGNKEVFDLLGNAATIGTHLVAATFVGLGIGWYLDKWLGTKPWLLLVFLCFGIGAGFKNVYDEVQRIQKRDQGKGPYNNEDKSED